MIVFLILTKTRDGIIIIIFIIITATCRYYYCDNCVYLSILTSLI